MVDPKTLEISSLVDCNVTLRSGRVVQSRGVVQAIGATFALVTFCSPDTDGAKLQGKLRKLPFDCMTLVA
jgi:hypothetical protein